jgi:integrase
MQWKEIQIDGEQARLNFTQQKTKGVEYMPISPQALELCGELRKPEQLVFEDLPDPSWISRPLKKWLEKAGITKKITFHCFRHTFATLQLTNGTDKTLTAKHPIRNTLNKSILPHRNHKSSKLQEASSAGCLIYRRRCRITMQTKRHCNGKHS